MREKQAPECRCRHGSSDRKSVGGRRNKREDEGACASVLLCVCLCVCTEGVTEKGDAENESEKETGVCVCVWEGEKMKLEEPGMCSSLC